MSVTLKQVAREADVSIATVSRVLSDKGPALEETRRRILKVAARLRYVPHGGARSLITSRTSTIGVLLPEEIALGGFDDVPLARFTAPPLTTVRVPILEMGVRAMERLFAAIDGTPPARRRRHETLETALVVRDSSGTPTPVSAQGRGVSRRARGARSRN